MATATKDKEAPALGKEQRKLHDRIVRMALATEAAGLKTYATELHRHASEIENDDRPKKRWISDLDKAITKDTGDGEDVDLRYGVPRQAVAYVDRLKQGIEDPDLLGDLLYRPVFMAERIDAQPKSKAKRPRRSSAAPSWRR